MSWLLPSFFTSPFNRSTPTASTSHSDTSTLNGTPRPRRFPPPPARTFHDRSASPEDSIPAGKKRDRGWLPPSSSFNSRTEEGGGDALEPSMTGARAEGAFDTPRSYYAAVRAGEQRREEDARKALQREEEEVEEERPLKRRRGLIGTALSITLDAAIFTSSVGYSAYQLWKNPPSNADIDQHLARSKSAHPSPTEAPPPYTEAPPAARSIARMSPSQIPRRIRHAHPPRPRPPHGRRSFPLISDFTSETSYAPPDSSSSTYNPFSSLRLLPHELPQFHPMEKDAGDGEGGEDEEEDEDMKAVAERFKSLIESGREALVSRPTWNPPSPTAPTRIDTSHRPSPLPNSSSVSRPTTPQFSRFAAPTSSSAAKHSRRPSTMDATVGEGRERSRSPVKSSFGGSTPVRKTHTPRSSRGGSLAGVITNDLKGGARQPVSDEGVRAFEGALQRASTKSTGKGWWEQ